MVWEYMVPARLMSIFKETTGKEDRRGRREIKINRKFWSRLWWKRPLVRDFGRSDLERGVRTT